MFSTDYPQQSTRQIYLFLQEPLTQDITPLLNFPGTTLHILFSLSQRQNSSFFSVSGWFYSISSYQKGMGSDLICFWIKAESLSLYQSLNLCLRRFRKTNMEKAQKTPSRQFPWYTMSIRSRLPILIIKPLLSCYLKQLMFGQSYFNQKMMAYLASEKLNCVHDGNSELPGAIYIGNLEAARSMDTLKKHSIKAVLTVADGTNLSYKKQASPPEHLILPSNDVPSFDLSKLFNIGADFIQNNRKKGNVLVHCHAGISRSTTMVLAYLIKTNGWSLDKSLSEVRKRRPIVQPNPGFLSQLAILQKKLAKDPTNKTVSSVRKQEQTATKRASSQMPYKNMQKPGQRGTSMVRDKDKLVDRQLKDLLVNTSLKSKEPVKDSRPKQQKQPERSDMYRSEPKVKNSKEPFRLKDSAPVLASRNKPNYHFAQKSFNQTEVNSLGKDSFIRSTKLPSRN